MQTFLFLLSFLQSLFLPVSQPVDQPWGEHLKTPNIVVSRTTVPFHNAIEWLREQNQQLAKATTSSHIPALSIKLLQTFTINGKSVLLLNIPLDMGDSRGNTIYRNHPSIAIFESGNIVLVNGS